MGSPNRFLKDLRLGTVRISIKICRIHFYFRVLRLRRQQRFVGIPMRYNFLNAHMSGNPDRCWIFEVFFGSQ